MKKHLAIIASALALSAVPALAESEHDFPLTMAEFMEAYPEVTPEEFAEIDTAGDGMVSEEEYAAAQEAGLIDDRDG